VIVFTIYAPDLSQIGIVENYTSMQWLRKYSKAGQFELHLPPSELLAPENIIRNGNEAGVIESVNISLSEQGLTAEVRGRFLMSYLDRRIIWGLMAVTGTAENVMRTMVTNNLRGLPLTVADSAGYTGNVDYQCSYGNILAEIEDISEMTGLGVKVDFDRIFKVYKGLDRTASQAVNPRAIFSRDFENILTSEYTINETAYKNVALIAGKGEGVDRLLVTVGDETGLERRELFVDARDIGDGTTEEPISTPEQQAMLAVRGQQKLGELKTSEAFTATVDPYGNLKYKVDYDLGDIVTIIDMGIRTDARITEIKEIYEGGGLKLDLTLGYERMMRIV
jgi:hypothetical protein